MPNYNLVDYLDPTTTGSWAASTPSAKNLNEYVRDQLLTVCTSQTRPPAPVLGRHIYETDTGNEYVWAGTDWALYNTSNHCGPWTAYTPIWTSSGTQPAIGNGGFYDARYRLVGATLDVAFDFYIGTTTLTGTGAWYFSLPVGMTCASVYSQGNALMLVAQAAYWQGVVFANLDHIYVYCPTSSASYAMSSVSTGYPGTWGNGDRLWVSITLEVEVA